MKDLSGGVDKPYARDPETLESAAKYMIRNGRAWALDMLGLSEVPVTGRYAAARDKLLAADPGPDDAPVRRPPRVHTSINRNLPNCTCAPTGRPYRLCPEHGEPGIAVAPQKLPESEPPAPDRGGVIPVPGPRRTVTRVHVGPAPGVCSVDRDGCGYCIGVPCRSPSPTGGDAPDGDQ